ncbi:MAG: energy transducer TonB [Dialister invisus]
MPAESSSGNSILDQTAVNAVYGWQFVPAKQNGVAVKRNHESQYHLH